MSVKKKFSLAIVDVEKIDEINTIILKYGFDLQQYSTHTYFNLAPIDADHIYKDISFFQLESENESGVNKKLTDLIEEINQLDTQFAIRDEETHEMIVEINRVIAIYIHFDKVKFINEGTYEKIDAIDHLKTEFGICKTYNPNFRPLENRPLENMIAEPEIVYLFADSEENLSKLKDLICEKIMEIDSDFELELKQFRFID